MADFFANATLKKKLISITMLVCSIVLLLSSVAFISAEIFSFRKIMVSNGASLAEVIAANAAVSLAFDDRELADNTLSALAADPQIQMAYIFDLKDQPFARYFRQPDVTAGQNNRPPQLSSMEMQQLSEGIRAGKKSHYFSSRHLATFCPVYFEGNLVGMVYLNADMRGFYYWLRFFAGAGLIVVGASFLLAYFLSIRLQYLVTRPILYLVDKMRLVSAEEDFSIRAEKESHDEVGTLIDGFNNMLARIEDRDEQLERYRHHLEDLVFKGTAELQKANDQLKRTVLDLEKAKAEVEAASSAKSQFLANISHELRTPMVGVLSTSELLMDTGLDKDQRNLVETLNYSGEGLLTILNDLLDLSKIEAGKLVLEHIDFNLLEVIEAPLQLLGKSAWDKKVELICYCKPDVPLALRGDPGRLRQVIFNLIGNAIKFTPSGEVSLSVQVKQEHETKIDLNFLVRDTGIGIAPEAQQKIFEAFCQADNSITRHFGGTGLGLSIVRQLVEKMGGKVGLKSEPGKGSEFSFTISLEKHGRAVKNERAWKPLASGQRLLLVDDNLSVCQILQVRFNHCGFEVVTTRHPEEVLSLLKDASIAGKPFEAILMAADLPRNGASRLAEALTTSPFAAIRLISMLSRQAPPGSDIAGISASIFKPLLPSLVSQAVTRILACLSSAPGEKAVSMDCIEIAGVEESSNRKGKILIAEDNPTTQNLLKISLGSLGHEVIIVGDGRNAFEIWQRQSFDLVLMDCQMPEMDGYEATRKMRSFGCKLPIIALTANCSSEYAELCRIAGMDDFLCKPFKHKHLHQIVEKWLSASPPA